MAYVNGTQMVDANGRPLGGQENTPSQFQTLTSIDRNNVAQALKGPGMGWARGDRGYDTRGPTGQFGAQASPYELALPSGLSTMNNQQIKAMVQARSDAFQQQQQLQRAWSPSAVQNGMATQPAPATLSPAPPPPMTTAPTPAQPYVDPLAGTPYARGAPGGFDGSLASVANWQPPASPPSPAPTNPDWYSATSGGQPSPYADNYQAASPNQQGQLGQLGNYQTGIQQGSAKATPAQAPALIHGIGGLL